MCRHTQKGAQRVYLYIIFYNDLIQNQIVKIILDVLYIAAGETSSKAPPALQREQTNPRRNSTHNRVESRVLFKFEYENEEGEVQSILVKEVYSRNIVDV